MNNQIVLAAKLYDDMLENRRNILSDPTDIESADRFLEAAIQLSDLNLPNPFAGPQGCVFKMNQAIKPSKDNPIVTGVYEP